MSIIHTDSPSRLVRKLSGFTILEVLIAVIILSVGILGLAGLQAVALRNNHSAFLRSQATLLAYDISDRMRANLTTAQADVYNLAVAAEDTSCVGTGGCAADPNMARHDIFEWNDAVANALPNGQAVVCYDTTPGDGTAAATHSCDGGATSGVYTIKIWWDDDRTGTLTRFTTNFQP